MAVAPTPVPPPSPVVRQAVAALAPPSRPPAITVDDLYRRAVASLRRQAYGVALGDLQAARAMAPKDPRVLSAMGVAYDWLGRFDLSARYYDLAEAADPGSQVVAINRRYSRILQQHGGAVVDSQVVMAHDSKGAPEMISPTRGRPTRTAERARLPRPGVTAHEVYSG
jgi:tetratricopeptide (TPR) repeat protein